MTAPHDERTEDASDTTRLTWLRRVVWVVLLAGVVAFLVEGADNPPDPFLVPAGDGVEADDDISTGAAAPAPGPSSTSSTTGAAASSIPPSTTGPSVTSAPTNRPPPSPSTTAPPAPATAEPPPTPTAPSRRPLPGFGEIDFRITAPDGTTSNGVALLADDRSSRGQGLMEQTDLRGYDAMVFRFDRPSSGGFYMRNTRIPLSIAFFDENGRFVSSADMEPCPDEVEDCPSTFAEAPYLHAIEVAQGDLPSLGIGPGSVLSFP